MRVLRFLAPAILAVTPLAAQGHQHTAGMVHGAPVVDPPREGGQAAFAAIAEIVARLDADPATDWARVDLEALRAHLRDMDDVTLRSTVVTRPVEGGFEAAVSGAGRAGDAIRRMTAAHAMMVNGDGALQMTVTPTAEGATVRVVSATPGDARSVARLRGLGFIGVMTLGMHHQVHHEAIARGASPH